MRALEDQLRNFGRVLPAGVDADRERLELLVHAARGAVKATERLCALPFAERASGCSPEASAQRIFGDAAMAAKLEAERRTLSRCKAELAEFQQSHGLGPNGIAREVFRYELAAAHLSCDLANGRQELVSMLTPALVADTRQKLREFPRDEWAELLEGFDDLAAAVMAAA